MKLISFLFLLMTFTAQARLISLAHITNDTDGDRNKYYDLMIEVVDYDLVIAMVLERRDSRTNALIGTKRHPFTQLSSGIGLYRTDDRDVVVIKSSTFDQASGGPLEIRYLTSGITNRWRTEQLNLNYENGEWVVYGPNGNTFSSVHFTSKRILNKPIGIKDAIYR